MNRFDKFHAGSINFIWNFLSCNSLYILRFCECKFRKRKHWRRSKYILLVKIMILPSKQNALTMLFFLFFYQDLLVNTWKQNKLNFFWKKRRHICLLGRIPILNMFHFVSSPEPNAHRWAYSSISMLRRPSVVVNHRSQCSIIFYTETALPIKSIFVWNLFGKGERKFFLGILVTWPIWPPRPYMVKNLQKPSSPESPCRFSLNFVCSMRHSFPS